MMDIYNISVALKERLKDGIDLAYQPWVQLSPGYQLYYDGDLWSDTHNKVMKGSINEYGYKRISWVNTEGKSVRDILHRVMAQCFLKRPPGATHVHHIDFNKLNNEIENLICLTPKQHMEIHARRKLSKKRLTPEEILEVREKFRILKKTTPATKLVQKFSKEYGVSTTSMVHILRNKTHKDLLS